MLGAGVLVRLGSLVRLRPQWPCAPVSLHFLGGPGLSPLLLRSCARACGAYEPLRVNSS